MSKNNDSNEISNVLNQNKKSLTDHGQKLFDAINCFLEDDEQRQLTQALFKYQQDHNVFTLVRLCREVFDTKRKKSLMLFMRPVIPIRDRFHYDEYYKLFFPDEFENSKSGARSIFADLIPNELIEKTIEKANAKAKKAAEAAAIVVEQTTPVPKNLDFDMKQMTDSQPDESQTASNSAEQQKGVVKIGGFRIVQLKPEENESLGFNVCLGPTQTFIMVSYVESDSKIEKLGMKVGDEIVSVNEISLKMKSVDEAIDILSCFEDLQIVLQTSGFMPDDCEESGGAEATKQVQEENSDYKWVDPFNLPIREPNESVKSLKSHLRTLRLKINKKNFLNEFETLGITIRGGVEYELGIFVAEVEPNSIGANAGVRAGDQILKVNRQSFAHVTLMNAINILKTSVKLAVGNLASFDSSTLTIVVRYIGKLPMSLSLKLKDMNLSYMLISNTNEIKKRLDFKFIKQRINSFKKQNNSFKTMFKNINLDSLFPLIRYFMIEYLKFNLNIDHLIHLYKKNLKSHVEIAEKLRDFIFEWDLEYYDSYIFDLKFSLLTLQNRNLKKQINYVNFEKPEMLFSLNYVQMKSLEDLSKTSFLENNEDEEEDEEPQDDIDERIWKKNKRDAIRKLEHSKSLDNLVTLEAEVYNVKGSKEGQEKIQLDEETINSLLKDYKIPHLVSIKKLKPYFGLSVYGGIDTKQIIPRITHVQPNSCCDQLVKEGDLILNINQTTVLGETYRQIAKSLNYSYESIKTGEIIDLIVAEPN